MVRKESAETQDFVSCQDMKVDHNKRLEELGLVKNAVSDSAGWRELFRTSTCATRSATNKGFKFHIVANILAQNMINAHELLANQLGGDSLVEVPVEGLRERNSLKKDELRMFTSANHEARWSGWTDVATRRRMYSPTDINTTKSMETAVAGRGFARHLPSSLQKHRR